MCSPSVAILCDLGGGLCQSITLGPILTGIHTWGWSPKAAQSAALWRGGSFPRDIAPPDTPSLQPSQDGWALVESGKGEVGSEFQPLLV